MSISGLYLQFEFTDGFETMHKTWSSIEEVPYCFFFFRSSIKFQGHTSWKIDQLNPIWVRLLGRSQLSNPIDLPCYDNDTSSHTSNKLETSCYCENWSRIIYSVLILLGNHKLISSYLSFSMMQTFAFVFNQYRELVGSHWWSWNIDMFQL